TEATGGQPAPRARGRRAAFPLDRLAESPEDSRSPAAAPSPDAPQGGDGSASAARGRRRAALPAEQSGEHDVWTAASPDAPAAPTTGAAAGCAGATASRADRADGSDRARSERGRTRSGSLPTVAFWTVLTSLVPGSGLVTTRMRRLGWVLLAVVVLALLGA